MTANFLRSNRIATRTMRSYLGKLNFLAGLAFQLKPFLRPLWAAVAQAQGDLLWSRQVMHALTWLRVFFSTGAPILQRRFLLSVHTGAKLPTIIVTDASPWGLGGYCMVNNRIVSYFSEPVTADDELVLQCRIGDSAAQQTLELLAVLVALRAWRPLWQDAKVELTVKTDSMSALYAVMAMKCKGHGQITVAREIALELADCAFAPRVAHIRGEHNNIADVLSRLPADSSLAIPPVLSSAARTSAPARNAAYYTALP
eukprot:2544912-Amphidinium_carterae.1